MKKHSHLVSLLVCLVAVALIMKGLEPTAPADPQPTEVVKREAPRGSGGEKAAVMVGAKVRKIVPLSDTDFALDPGFSNFADTGNFMGGDVEGGVRKVSMQKGDYGVEAEIGSADAKRELFRQPGVRPGMSTRVKLGKTELGVQTKVGTGVPFKVSGGFSPF